MGTWLKRIGLGVLMIAIFGTVAERLGLDAYGVSADLRPYAGQEAREVLARNKDFLTAIMQPSPTFLGDPVSLSGSAAATEGRAQRPFGSSAQSQSTRLTISIPVPVVPQWSESRVRMIFGKESRTASRLLSSRSSVSPSTTLLLTCT